MFTKFVVPSGTRSGVFVIHKPVLAVLNLYTKFTNSSFTRSKRRKDGTKFANEVDWKAQSHSRSSVVSGAHTGALSYLPSTATMFVYLLLCIEWSRQTREMKYKHIKD